MEYLSHPPIMSSSEMDEILFAYIAVTLHAVSLVLIRVDNGIQRSIYYISQSLHEAEVQYLPLENAILAVVHVTRKLPHYFQTHTVVVLTQLPLKALLQNVDYTGRVAKWGMVLRAFDIKYMLHTSVKGQVLADLVAKSAEIPYESEIQAQHMDGKLVGSIARQESSHWKVYVNRVADQRRSGVGLVLISLEKLTIEKSLRLGVSATNNEVEYENLLEGMSMVQRVGGKTIKMFSDLRLVVGQVGGELEAKDERI